MTHKHDGLTHDRPQAPDQPAERGDQPSVQRFELPAAVARLAKLALSAPDLDSLFEATVQEVSRVLDVEFCGLFKKRDAGDEFLLIAGIGWPDHLAGHATIDAAVGSHADFALENRVPVIVTDFHQESRFRPSHLSLEYGALAGITVVAGPESNPWGLLLAQSARQRDFTPMEADFLQEIAGILQDAASTAQHTAQIRESEQYCRHIVDSLPMLVCYVDRDLTYRFCNAAYERWFGFSPDQLIGRRVVDVIGRSAFHRVESYIRRALRGERFATDEQFHFRRVGTRDIRVEYMPDVGEDGHVQGYYARVEDITERKANEAAMRASEARFASFLQSSETTAWMKDEQGRYIFVSESLEKRFNVPPGEWLGKTDPEIWPADILAHLQAHDQAVLRGAGPVEVEEELINPDGTRSWWLVHRFPFQGPAGKHYIGGLGVDISSRKRGEQELYTARIAAEAANEAKSQFLANVSHEIRTPMTAILGYVDLLAAHLHDPDDQLSVQIIRRHGNYLCDILNDILDLSKMEAGKLTIASESCEILQILADVYSMMTVRAIEQGLSFDIIFNGPIPRRIQSDSKRIRQILVNLVGNAIKFTRRGQVCLAVEFLADREQLKIDVIDTGIGIDQEMKSRLFQPFEQLDSSLTREIGGTGLGLAISKRLAEMLGGDISVDSKLDEGSTFSITLATGPVQQSDLITPVADDVKGQTRDENQAPSVQITCRVLVVDDRRDVRYLAQHFIESAGGQVVLAKDGREALECIAAAEKAGESIEAIVMDMQMPVMDGYHATRQLRETGFRGPIIALTAHAMVGDREKCLQAGCDGYLSKPLDRGALIQTLAEHVESCKSLAVESGPAEDFPLNQSGREQPTAHQPENRGTRVLLVDDSPDICRMLKMYFEGKGHSVRIATSGTDALAAVEQEVPEVVVLDLGLPEISGEELVRSLKSRHDCRDCFFICQSGRSQKEVDWKGMGFDEYLQKPPDLDALEQLIRSRGRR